MHNEYFYILYLKYILKAGVLLDLSTSSTSGKKLNQMDTWRLDKQFIVGPYRLIIADYSLTV